MFRDWNWNWDQLLKIVDPICELKLNIRRFVTVPKHVDLASSKFSKMHNRQQFTFSQLSGNLLILLVFCLGTVVILYAQTNWVAYSKIYMTLSLGPEIKTFGFAIFSRKGNSLASSNKQQHTIVTAPIIIIHHHITCILTKTVKEIINHHFYTQSSHFDHQPVTESESCSASGSVHGQHIRHIRRTLTLH